jgi:hypothetical protein
MCRVTKEITKKIDKLQNINKEIISYPDDLLRLPGVLEADTVREEYIEESYTYKKKLDREVKEYSDNVFKKNIALQAIDECITSAIDIAIIHLNNLKQQNNETQLCKQSVN